MVQNILTVDLEDWFVVENLKDKIEYKKWSKQISRVEETTENILQIFSDFNVCATFFTLGWVAEKFPRLIDRIAREGHEIACHSYHHDRVDLMGERQFRKDTEQAVEAIIKACGIKPVGYRAPSWSINSKIPWAYEILAELGFMYDSSVYPIKHDIYGDPGGLKRVAELKVDNGGKLWEIPASTIKILGKEIPVGGGGYLRHSPLWFTSRMIKKINRENRPAIIYLHPWEVDKNQPRVEGLSAFRRYRQYGSISTLAKKLELILKEFDFCTAKEYILRLIKRPIGFEQ
jgi:polysaccharide deacetylase family protein (PEP-CTERM system associated)